MPITTPSFTASTYTQTAQEIANRNSRIDDIMLRAAAAPEGDTPIDISPYEISGQSTVPATAAQELVRDMKEWSRSLLQWIGQMRQDEAQWFRQMMNQMAEIMKPQ
jgi:hypothetical protein